MLCDGNKFRRQFSKLIWTRSSVHGEIPLYIRLPCRWNSSVSLFLSYCSGKAFLHLKLAELSGQTATAEVKAIVLPTSSRIGAWLPCIGLRGQRA